MARRGTDIDMLNGSLADKMLLFALPLMASSMLQLLFNAADVVVVGRFAGKEALAAVGSNTALINLIVAIFVGLSIGVNVVVARDLGAGNKESVSKSVHSGMFIALVGGVLVGTFGILMSRTMLVWMSSPADVIDLGADYLRIYFMGMPALMVYNFGSAVLRAKGDTRRPLYFLSLAGVINVVLNLYFVIVLSLSVVGVALATIISQYVSAVLVVLCLLRESGALRLDLKKIRMDWGVTERILYIGLPAGFQSVMFSISNVMIQSTVNGFDSSSIMSGCAAAANIESFVYMSMNAFHQTAITFVGQNYGAGKCKRIDKIIGLSLGYVLFTGVVFGNIAYYNGHALLGLYAPGEEEAIAAGMLRMACISRFYFFAGIMDVMVGVLRGLGRSVIPMFVTLFGVCGLRLVWIWYIFPMAPTPTTLFASYPITWIITEVILFVMFFFIRKPTYEACLREASR